MRDLFSRVGAPGGPDSPGDVLPLAGGRGQGQGLPVVPGDGDDAVAEVLQVPPLQSEPPGELRRPAAVLLDERSEFWGVHQQHSVPANNKLIL